MNADIIIIGAGPVGLMLANLLGKAGIKVLIFEKEPVPPGTSRAIGVMPPSLHILKHLNLDQAFINKGLKIQKVRIHGDRKEVGWITFNRLNYNYNYILSIPQFQTENILEHNLRTFDKVKLIRGNELTALRIEKDKVIATVRLVNSQKAENYTANYLVACDGVKSTVRNIMNIDYIGQRYKQTFLMGDFNDNSGFLDEAHLFFTPRGSVESFPLPGGIRRWIIQTPYFMNEPDKNYLIDQIYHRTGITLDSKTKKSDSPFGVQHYIANTYYKNRIFLCGDAAHAMSPIGGQGMNTGFADAHFLSEVLIDFTKHNYFSSTVVEKYEKYRKKAVKTAISRADLSMTIGTFKGIVLSFIRYLLVLLVIKTPIRKKAASYFSMLTIPFNTLEKVLKKEKSLFKGNK